MHSQAGKQTLLQRFLARETRPDWSLATGLFFAVAYTMLWIIGQIIVSTLSRTGPSPASLSIGALIGCLFTIIVAVQWAQRRLKPNRIDALRLRAPIRPPQFAII